MSVLNEACEQLTVLRVAESLGIQGLKVGMNKSPFRQVKSGEPFSIHKQGHAFKDHGNDEHKGGVWEFLQLARPNMTKKECAEYLIELAGLDPKADRFSKNAFRQMKRESRKAAYKARDAEFLKLKQFDPPAPWPDAVRQQWNDGRGGVPIGRLAESRGWPEHWIDWLIEWNKVSFPWLPWADGSFKKARHGLAFLVEYPVFDLPKGTVRFHPAGYHQQWLRMDEGKRKKDWLFLPCVPRKVSTPFQRAMLSDNRRVHPFPFVLGDHPTPRNIIITEGQWDAISIFGAAGWFSDSEPPATMVFGLRGSQSIEVFLAFYGPWLRAIQPNILMLPDNDAAGRKWIEPVDDNKIVPKPTFAQRLTAWGAKHVAHRSIDHKYGKDFNDYYKARRPDAAAMHDWFISCGLEF